MKWVGGKTQLLPVLSQKVPEDTRRYFEPFAGGGALFFALQPVEAVISDLNADLIRCWTAVRDDVDAVIGLLHGHRYEKDYFYSVRALDPETLPIPEAAARTIFLNRTGFNGLYRVNRKGQFNVPFGRYSNPLICDEENLRACSKALKGTELLCAPFDSVLAKAEAGDFAYLDPPYVPVSATANFTQYVAGGFGPEDQQNLADTLVDLDRRGVRFALSNADKPETRALYSALDIPTLRIEGIQAKRSVNCRTDGRGKVGELIVSNA